jgi:hypothetical protein
VIFGVANALAIFSFLQDLEGRFLSTFMLPETPLAELVPTRDSEHEFLNE